MQKLDRKPDMSTILNLLNLDKSPLTQDRIIFISQLPRTTVSSILSELTQLGYIKCLQKPKSRILYYYPRLPRILFLPAKFIKEFQFLQQVKIFLKSIEKEMNENKIESSSFSTLLVCTDDAYSIYQQFILSFLKEYLQLIECC